MIPAQKPTPPNKNPNRAGARGNTLTADPGRQLRRQKLNCSEIQRACDAFLLTRIPGWRIMNHGGR